MNRIRRLGRPARFAAATIVALSLAACATRPPADDAEAVAEFDAINDPAEPTNRAIFAVNEAVDTFLLAPVSRTYRFVVPEIPRQGIHNVLSNLREPVAVVNSALQGQLGRAGVSLGRFCLNTTVGLLGLFDVAKEVGMPRHKEDFGQTLAVWGIGEGPYLMLPVLGPSNPRDTVGLVVDYLLDPFGWWARASNNEEVQYIRTGIMAVDERTALLDPLDEVKRGSIDYYASIRTLYRQRRNSQIGDKAVPNEPPGYNFSTLAVPGGAVNVTNIKP